MKKLFFISGFWLLTLGVQAQRVLTLDSCRALALRNNKQLNISKLNQNIAKNIRKSARTKYLPKVDAAGGYQYFNKEISILNNGQKAALGHLGTNAMAGLSTNMSTLLTGLAQNGLISPQVAQDFGAILNQMGGSLAQAGDQFGQGIADAFRTDNRNLWTGMIMLRQPIYMGGAIIASNKMADIGEEIASNDLDLKTQTTLYNIDQTYWTIVSLRQKQKLANSYRDLVNKLNTDVQKMIKEGVATRADGLKVAVKVNEADMQVTQVEDGLSLAQMLLCQICGLPLEEKIILADEYKDTLDPSDTDLSHINDTSLNARPEIRMLQNAVDMSIQNTRLVQAAYLPHIALTGGYMISNPNVFNGFEKKFSGVWNVGIMVQVPVWNWFDGRYKVRASKAATEVAITQLSDLQEKINLQISQSKFKVREAQKKFIMATQNLKSADENLRCANLGFKEGVMDITDVMAAQTAWQQAQSQKIDAEVEVKLTQVNLLKALGVLE